MALASAEAPQLLERLGVGRCHDGGHGLSAIDALGDHGGLGGADGHRQLLGIAQKGGGSLALVVCGVVLLGDDDVVVHQLAVLHIDDVVDGILQPQARQQKRRAAGDAHARHDETALVAEDVAERHLPRERETAPQGPDALQQNALAGLGRRRLHEGGRGLAQGGRGGSPSGQKRDADAESGRGERDGPVDGHGGAGHVVDDGVGLHDDPGQHLGEHRDAENAAEPCGQSGVDEVLRRDARPRVAERLEGADEHALLFHHAGHGGKSHKRRHEEEDEGEERRDGVDAIGIGGEAHHAEVLRAVHDEPIRRLDVVNLLLSVGELLLRFVQLLVGLGRGGVVVGHALLVLGPGRLQVGFGLFVFRLALFQLLLAFLDARLGLIEPSLSRGDLRVGGGALLRQLRLRLLQGRRRSGDVGDLLLQVGAGRLKLRALLSGEVRHLQGGLGLGQGVLQRRQCRIGFGEVRLIGGDLLLGLGELRLGVGLALGKRFCALGVLLLAVLDLFLARRKRGSGCIQLALALVQLFLGRIQLGAGIGELGLRAGLLFFVFRSRLVQIGLGLGLQAIHPGLFPGRRDALDGGHNAGHAIVVGVAVGGKLCRPFHGDVGLHVGHVRIEGLRQHVHELLDGARANGGGAHGRRADVERRVHAPHHGELGFRQRVLHIAHRRINRHRVPQRGGTAHNAVVEDDALVGRGGPTAFHQIEPVEIIRVIGGDGARVRLHRRRRRGRQRVHAHHVLLVVQGGQHVGRIGRLHARDAGHIAQGLDVLIRETQGRDDADVHEIGAVVVGVGRQLHIRRRHAQPGVEAAAQRHDGGNGDKAPERVADGADNIFVERLHATTPARRRTGASRSVPPRPRSPRARG